MKVRESLQDAVMKIYHMPVMTDLVIASLEVRPGGTYVDCTLGEGGHALSILSAVNPPPVILGVELDANAISVASSRLESFGENVILAHDSFANIYEILKKQDLQQPEGVLFDFGVSSLQLESQNRGFSFSKPGRLDMRFDTRQWLTAHHLVNKRTEQQLASIIYQFGEEPKANQVAKIIVKSRPINSCSELAKVVARAAGSSARRRIHPATKTFQALRIAVNDELDNIKTGLNQAVKILRKGGKLVAISYHSLEDRLVKQFMSYEASECVCPPRTPICVCTHIPTLKLDPHRSATPSKHEIGMNWRARSARLRVAERI